MGLNGVSANGVKAVSGKFNRDSRADFWCACGDLRGVPGGLRDAFGDLNSMLGGLNGFREVRGLRSILGDTRRSQGCL